MVDKITDVQEIFNAHIQTQKGQLPLKIYYFNLDLKFAEIKKRYVCVLNFEKKADSEDSKAPRIRVLYDW